nr:hypothetical protein [Tanacetum cinerariifolium]
GLLMYVIAEIWGLLMYVNAANACHCFRAG